MTNQDNLTARSGYALMVSAVLLSGCSAEVSGYSLEKARVICEGRGGIGFVRAQAIPRDASQVYCINGESASVYRGKAG